MKLINKKILNINQSIYYKSVDGVDAVDGKIGVLSWRKKKK